MGTVEGLAGNGWGLEGFGGHWRGLEGFGGCWCVRQAGPWGAGLERGAILKALLCVPGAEGS